MRTILTIAALGTLAGCVPYAQRVAATCEGYGYSPGTRLFLSCIQGEEVNDTAAMGMWSGITQAGLYMAQPPQPVVVYRGY